MLKLVVGFLVGAGLSAVSSNPWAVAGGLALLGAALEVFFAQRLNGFLKGRDPVSIGARSLKELRTIVAVPWTVVALDFAAKVALWGVVAALLALLGWVRFE